MRKEAVREQGHTTAIYFHAQRPYLVAPVIEHEFTEGGVRMYKDKAGHHHVADMFDKAWGKRDPAAILPMKKRQFQRTFRQK